MKPNRSRSAALRGLPLMLLFMVGGVGLWLTFGLSAAPVPARKPAAYPAWWFQREVIPAKDATKASPTYPGDYPPAADYAVLTQGQLKHLATAAFDELQAHLPGEAGPAVTELVKGWYVLDGDAFHLDAQGHRVALASPQTKDFGPVTHGQLKEVAHYFFDRLQAELYYPTDQPYPWNAPGAKPPADNAVANLGQAKNLFKFDLTTDTIGDGIPDWWKRAHGLPTTKPIAMKRTAGGRMTNLAAFRDSLDPNDQNAASSARHSLADEVPPVVIKLEKALLDKSASDLIESGSEPLIKNGDFEEDADDTSPVSTGGFLGDKRKWYVKEGPSAITSGGWTAIGGYHDQNDTDTSRMNYLQWEVQQQINDYKFPTGHSRTGYLNQYAELDAHPERKDANGSAIRGNSESNVVDKGTSDWSQRSDHGIKQTVDLARGSYLLIFDYRGRVGVRNSFSVSAQDARDVDVLPEAPSDPEEPSDFLIEEKNAITSSWNRAYVSFTVSGGDEESDEALPVVLKFDVKLSPGEQADSYGVFIDNVILIPVQVYKLWSDQITDGATHVTDANYLPNHTGGQQRNYMLMGASRSSTYTNTKGHLQAHVNVGGPAALRNKILWRLAAEDNNGEFAPEAGSSSYNSAGWEATIKVDAPRSDHEYSSILRGGYDIDGDDQLSLDETLFTPYYEHKDSNGEIDESIAYEVKVISRSTYNQYHQTITNVKTAWNIAGFVQGARIVEAFLTESTPTGATVPASATTIASNEVELTHAVGIIFTAPGNPGTSIKAVFGPNSEMTRAVLDSTRLKQILSDLLRSKYQEVQERFTTSTNAIETFNWNTTPNSFNFSFGTDTDLSIALGQTKITEIGTEVEVNRAGYTIVSFKVTATVTDLIDYDYDGPPIWPDWVRQTACIQAGYNTNGQGGRVYRVEIQMQDSRCTDLEGNFDWE